MNLRQNFDHHSSCYMSLLLCIHEKKCARRLLKSQCVLYHASRQKAPRHDLDVRVAFKLAMKLFNLNCSSNENSSLAGFCVQMYHCSHGGSFLFGSGGAYDPVRAVRLHMCTQAHTHARTHEHTHKRSLTHIDSLQHANFTFIIA